MEKPKHGFSVKFGYGSNDHHMLYHNQMGWQGNISVDSPHPDYSGENGDEMENIRVQFTPFKPGERPYDDTGTEIHPQSEHFAIRWAAEAYSEAKTINDLDAATLRKEYTETYVDEDYSHIDRDNN